MRLATLILAAGLGFAGHPVDAASRPRCDGDFQLVRGSWVSTRYCRAAQIAAVARESGMMVSTEEILRSRSRAEEACRFVGADIRVQPACDQTHAIIDLAF